VPPDILTVVLHNIICSVDNVPHGQEITSAHLVLYLIAGPMAVVSVTEHQTVKTYGGVEVKLKELPWALDEDE
jgi:hypothetical protein